MNLWYRCRGLLAGRRERLEGALVGVPAVHAEAWVLVVEPREEGKLLRVVGKPVERIFEALAGQRVAYLEVGLAAADLADVAPGRGRVGGTRVVLPFGHLMGEDRDVRRAGEQAGVVVHRHSVGLNAGVHVEGVVIPGSQALGAADLCEVVQQEDRERRGADTLAGQRRDDDVPQAVVQPAEVGRPALAVTAADSLI